MTYLEKNQIYTQVKKMTLKDYLEGRGLPRERDTRQIGVCESRHGRRRRAVDKNNKIPGGFLLHHMCQFHLPSGTKNFFLVLLADQYKKLIIEFHSNVGYYFLLEAIGDRKINFK